MEPTRLDVVINLLYIGVRGEISEEIYISSCLPREAVDVVKISTLAHAAMD